MIIDCDSCIVREIACHDCVVSSILTAKPVDAHKHDVSEVEITEVEITEDEKAVIALLSSRGLVPPLRFGDNSQKTMRA